MGSLEVIMLFVVLGALAGITVAAVFYVECKRGFPLPGMTCHRQERAKSLRELSHEWDLGDPEDAI